jgi:uncharacterized protein YraI
MNFRKFAAAAIIAVTGVLATVTGAQAYQAFATTALNVRTGPGTNYPVIAALSANQVVEVSGCNSSNTWCQVAAANISGWASARYLRAIEGNTPTRPPVPAPNRPDIGFSINTPNFNVTIGNNRPGTPAPSGRVCFYEEYDYAGRSFCAAHNDNERILGNFWNDRIRSARVEGNVSATVCTRANFNGRCAVIDRSVRNLGMLSDDISSYYLGRR